MPQIVPRVFQRRLPRGADAFLFVPPVQARPIKTQNASGEIIHNFLTTIGLMQNPLIAIHMRPDPDALGSALTLLLYLGRGSIFIPESEMKFMPKFFLDIIEAEGITIVHTVSRTTPYDLILVDAPGLDRLEVPIQELIQYGYVNQLVDIDHHVGEPLMAHPSVSLVSEEVSSVAELLCQLLPEADLSETMARCLLAGILDDTQNLNFRVGRSTESRVQHLERVAGTSREHVYAELESLYPIDQALIAEALPMVVNETITIGTSAYRLAWIDEVTLQQALATAREKQSLPDEPRNFAKALEKQIGFGPSNPDIVMIISYDSTKGAVRCGLYAYNRGGELDFRPTAEEIRSMQPRAKGGGHSGAAKFDLLSYASQDPAEVVAMIKTTLQKYPAAISS